jgi:hypothetical protein
MRLILTLLTCSVLISCGLSSSEKESTLKLIDKIDSIGIDSIKHWDYRYRGSGVRSFYRRDLDGNLTYSFTWQGGNSDSTDIILTSLPLFSEDFTANPFVLRKAFLERDSAGQFLPSVKLRKYTDRIKIFGIGLRGLVEIIQIDSADYNSFFPVGEPVEFLTKRNEFYDKSGIVEHITFGKPGDIIQFQLNNGYVLSYVAQGVDNNEQYQQEFKDKVKQGDRIKENWYYRKAENLYAAKSKIHTAEIAE